VSSALWGTALGGKAGRLLSSTIGAVEFPAAAAAAACFEAFAFFLLLAIKLS